MTNYANYKLPFGLVEIGYDDHFVLSINIIKEVKKYNNRTYVTDKIFEQIMEYLEGKREVFEFSYKLVGTKFQLKVWDEIIRIPYGGTRTYKEIAVAIGSPNSCRAVGNAANKNPLMIVVPCHRVVGLKGQLTGYANGIDIKRTLLNIEKENK